MERVEGGRSVTVFDIPGESQESREELCYHTVARRLILFTCPSKGLVNDCYDSAECCLATIN